MKLLPNFFRLLPKSISKILWSVFWKDHWQKQRDKELQELGPDAPTKEIANSERAVILENIVSEYPFDSLLEVACSWGQNFFTLVDFCPSAKFTGIDHDKKAIEYGKNLFASHKSRNVSLQVTDARDLSMFEDKHFDIVVSCAFFLYVWPDDVDAVLSEMFRVAKRKIIFMEQHVQNPEGNKNYIGTYCNFEGEGQGYWLKDYEALLQKYVSPEQIKVTKVKNPRWSQERWGEFAHLVEVRI